MAEATQETAPAQAPAAEPAFDREVDVARMKKIGTQHFVAVMAAITLWGAADAWAAASGWGLAWIVAMVNAVIAGVVITSTLHEWGHFAGARLSGAHAPVLEKPNNYFFMFNFDFERSDQRQFVWMSWGGILVPWLLVLATLAWVPIDNVSRAMLLAVFVSQAVAVSVFELPVVLRAQGGADPRAELGRQLKEGFLKKGRYYGYAVGALVWLVA